MNIESFPVEVILYILSFDSYPPALRELRRLNKAFNNLITPTLTCSKHYRNHLGTLVRRPDKFIDSIPAVCKAWVTTVQWSPEYIPAHAPFDDLCWSSENAFQKRLTSQREFLSTGAYIPFLTSLFLSFPNLTTVILSSIPFPLPADVKHIYDTYGCTIESQSYKLYLRNPNNDNFHNDDLLSTTLAIHATRLHSTGKLTRLSAGPIGLGVLDAWFNLPSDSSDPLGRLYRNSKWRRHEWTAMQEVFSALKELQIIFWTPGGHIWKYYEDADHPPRETWTWTDEQRELARHLGWLPDVAHAAPSLTGDEKRESYKRLYRRRKPVRPSSPPHGGSTTMHTFHKDSCTDPGDLPYGKRRTFCRYDMITEEYASTCEDSVDHRREADKIKWRSRSPDSQAAFLEAREERRRKWFEEQRMLDAKGVATDDEQISSTADKAVGVGSGEQQETSHGPVTQPSDTGAPIEEQNGRRTPIWGGMNSDVLGERDADMVDDTHANLPDLGSLEGGAEPTEEQADITPLIAAEDVEITTRDVDGEASNDVIEGLEMAYADDSEEYEEEDDGSEEWEDGSANDFDRFSTVDQYSSDPSSTTFNTYDPHPPLPRPVPTSFLHASLQAKPPNDTDKPTPIGATKLSLSSFFYPGVSVSRSAAATPLPNSALQTLHLVVFPFQFVPARFIVGGGTHRYFDPPETTHSKSCNCEGETRRERLKTGADTILCKGVVRTWPQLAALASLTINNAAFESKELENVIFYSGAQLKTLKLHNVGLVFSPGGEDDVEFEAERIEWTAYGTWVQFLSRLSRLHKPPGASSFSVFNKRHDVDPTEAFYYGLNVWKHISTVEFRGLLASRIQPDEVDDVEDDDLRQAWFFSVDEEEKERIGSGSGFRERAKTGCMRLEEIVDELREVDVTKGKGRCHVA